jgi:HPt (histidine-containing phosphotransfer) domain-containing protein
MKLSALNLQILKETLLNNSALLMLIAQTACEDIVERCKCLHQAHQLRDSVLAKYQAHALKGGLASLTAFKAADMASDLEVALNLEDWDMFGKKLILFEAEAEQVIQIFKNEVLNQPTSLCP